MLALSAEPVFIKYYNRKINEFLGTEFYDNVQLRKDHNDFDLEDELVPFFGGFHFLHENLDKCYQVALDLYYWSDDYFTHHLDNLHNFALYNFLNYIAHWSHEDDYINELYFNGEDEKKQISKIWKELDKSDFEFLHSERDLAEHLHDIYDMIGACFEDIDFLTFPEIICKAIAGGEDIPRALVNDYKKLLPRDILEYYEEIHDDQKYQSKLFGELTEIWMRMEHELKYSHAYKLFWKDELPANEDNARNYVYTVLKEHFANTNTLVDREVDYGTGQVDFRLVGADGDKVLVEAKVGSYKALHAGITKQLAHYMGAERCKQAFYLIFCHTTAEIERARNLAKELSPIISKNLIIKIFDVTKKTPASKLR